MLSNQGGMEHFEWSNLYGGCRGKRITLQNIFRRHPIEKEHPNLPFANTFVHFVDTKVLNPKGLSSSHAIISYVPRLMKCVTLDESLV